MNAGAYGREMQDVVISSTAVDRAGKVHTVTAAEMGFSYRHCSVPEDWIFLRTVLAAPSGNAEDIADRMAQIRDKREASQPIRTRTGGSTFANPDGAKAWELIDQAGCRGLRHGGAMISEKHCNFLINTGTATATDLEELGEDVRERVLKETGYDLHWEIRRIGDRK
jgi:UDP-N-acetylmuramate dehydrogenase